MIELKPRSLHPEAIALPDRFDADNDVDLATKLAFKALMEAASDRAIDQQIAKAIAAGEDTDGMLVGGPSLTGILEVLLSKGRAGYIRAFAESRIPRCDQCDALMDSTPPMPPPPRQTPRREARPWSPDAGCYCSVGCQQASRARLVKAD